MNRSTLFLLIVFLISQSVFATVENNASISVIDHGALGLSVIVPVAESQFSNPSGSSFSRTDWVIVPEGCDIEVNAAPTGRLNDVMLKVGSAGIFRGRRIAPVYLTFNSEVLPDEPIEYEVRFVPTQSRRQPPRPVRDHPGSATASVLNNLVLNPPQRDPAFADRPSNFTERMLILHNDDLDELEGAVEAVNNFAEWKRRMGYWVDVLPIDEDEVEPVDIRQIIRDDYYFVDDPLSHLVIIGDDTSRNQPIYFPRFYSDSAYHGDHLYTLMDDDNELLGDISIGRMGVANASELCRVLQRSVLYESDPVTEDGTEWFSSAITTVEYIGGMGGGMAPSQINMGRWIHRNLSRYGYNPVDLLIDSRGEDNSHLTRAALAEGRSLALSYGWLKGAWHLEDGIAPTGRKNPFVVAIHCLSDYIQDPFFRGVDDEDLSGSIASLSINGLIHSTSSQSYLTSVVRAITIHDILQPGWIQHYAKLNHHIDVLNEELEPEAIAIFKLLGDPSVQIFTRAPQEISVEHPENLSTGTTGIDIEVMSADEPVPDAVVCIYQPDNFHLVALPGENGVARFTLEPEALEDGEIMLTVTRPNTMPYLTSIPVEAQDVEVTLAEVEFDNEDGLFAFGETVSVSLTLQNTGDDIARDLTAQISTDSPWAQLSTEDFYIGDLEDVEEINIENAFEVIISAACPEAAHVRIALDLSADDQHWQASFGFETSAPQLVCQEVLFDAGHELLPGAEDARIAPMLLNHGAFANPVIEATLEVLSPGISIIGGMVEYPVVQPDGNPELPLNNAFFVVEADPLFIPGNLALFRLNLSDGEENGFRAVVNLPPLQVGEAEASDPFGPDGYGYYAFDQVDEDWDNAPVYDWIEINPFLDDHDFEGERLELNDNRPASDSTIVLPLPFPFQFYGVEYDTLVVNSNGWIAFGSENAIFNNYINWRLPDGPGPEPMIAVFWQDLINPVPDRRGFFHYLNEDEGLYIIEWSQLKIYEDHNPDVNQNLVEFQVILFDSEAYPTVSGDGEILCQYKSIIHEQGDIWANPYFTLGLKDHNGINGLQCAYGNHYPAACSPLEDGSAILYTTDLVGQKGYLSLRLTHLREPYDPIPDVSLHFRHEGNGRTNEDGVFFAEIDAGQHNLILSKPTYNDLLMSLTVAYLETTFVDTGLTYPLFAITSENTEVAMQPDHRTEGLVTLSNEGDGSMDFHLTRVYTDGGEPQFDLTGSIPVSDLANGDYNIYDCQFIDSLLYVAGGGDRRDSGDEMIYVLNHQGELVNQFAQPCLNSRGFRNLAWDGEYLYGSDFDDEAATSIIVKFTLEGEVIESIPVPIDEDDFALWGLTWSPVDSTLWLSVDSNRLYTYSLDNNQFRVKGVVTNPEELMFRGLTWFGEDNDNYYLYASCDLSAARGMVAKIDPLTLNIIQLTEYEGFYPFGISTGYDWEQGLTSFALVRNTGAAIDPDSLLTYNIAPDSRFLTFEDHAGSVVAASDLTIPLQFNSDGLQLGEYSCGLRISHNARGESALIPVRLTVSADARAGESPELPTTFTLFEPFPNPFNATVEIGYALPEAGRVRLSVYDLQGRMIDQVHTEIAQPGIHKFSLNAMDYASGIYVVQVDYKGMLGTRKIVCLK